METPQQSKTEFRSKSTIYEVKDNGEETYIYHGDENNEFRKIEKQYRSLFSQSTNNGKELHSKKKTIQELELEKLEQERKEILKSKIFDFSNLENNSEENKTLIETQEIECSKLFSQEEVKKLNFSEKIQVYSIKPLPGFYILPKAFTAKGQRHWVRRCLKDFIVG